MRRFGAHSIISSGSTYLALWHGLYFRTMQAGIALCKTLQREGRYHICQCIALGFVGPNSGSEHQNKHNGVAIGVKRAAPKLDIYLITGPLPTQRAPSRLVWLICKNPICKKLPHLLRNKPRRKPPNGPKNV